MNKPQILELNMQLLKLFIIICLMPSLGMAHEYGATHCPKADDLNRYINVPLIADLKSFAKIENIETFNLDEDAFDYHEGYELKLYFELLAKYDPNKETIIFVPGGPGEDHTFIHEFEDLFEGKTSLFQDFNIVVMEHRGLGCTRPHFPGQAPPESLRMRYAAADIEYIRRSLDPNKKIHVWGFSYGTMLAQTYALLFPESVELLFLGGAFSAASEFKQARLDFESLVATSSIGEESYYQFIQKYPNYRTKFLDLAANEMYSYIGRKFNLPLAFEKLIKALDAGDTESVDEILDNGPKEIMSWMSRSVGCNEVFDYDLPEGQYGIFHEMFKYCEEYSEIKDYFDYTSSLKNITATTFIWGGKYDHVTPAKSMEKMSKLIPDNRLYIDKDLSHSFNAKVDCFIGTMDIFFNKGSSEEMTTFLESSVCADTPIL